MIRSGRPSPRKADLARLPPGEYVEEPLSVPPFAAQTDQAGWLPVAAWVSGVPEVCIQTTAHAASARLGGLIITSGAGAAPNGVLHHVHGQGEGIRRVRRLW